VLNSRAVSAKPLLRQEECLSRPRLRLAERLMVTIHGWNNGANAAFSRAVWQTALLVPADDSRASQDVVVGTACYPGCPVNGYGYFTPSVGRSKATHPPDGPTYPPISPSVPYILDHRRAFPLDSVIQYWTFAT